MNIRVWREQTAERMNGIINAPGVRETMDAPSDRPLDITALVRDPGNCLIMGEHGGIMFIRLLPGVYECHTAVDRCARGPWARGLIDAAAHWMFTRTDAYEITTRVPRGHVAALAATMAAGLKLEMTLPNAVNFRGKTVDCHVFSYRIQDWLTLAPDLVERGRWVHARLKAEASRLGISEPPHDDDDLHNRYVGVAIDMGLGGQVAKGVLFYNRWALMARHRTISLIGDRLIRFDAGCLKLLDDDIEVIRDAV